MNPLEALKCCAEAKYSFGFLAPQKNLFLSWGEEMLNESIHDFSLHFQNFYPEARKSFRNFPTSGKIHLKHFLEIESPVFVGKKNLDKFYKKSENPARQEWNTFCEKIHIGIAKNEFQKIVAARSEILESTGEIHLTPILENLFSHLDQRTYRFFFKWEDSCFLGATPELLLESANEKFFVPAIAGTLAYDKKSPPSDLKKKDFLHDTKEREEHLFVVRGIQEILMQLGLSIDPIPEPTILDIPGLLHLFTPIRGYTNRISIVKIVEALHPTPAIGGYPPKVAQDFLKSHEPLNRGLFASPLHFQMKDRDLVLVGIRSALVEKNTLTFFAGAGFVKQSSAEGEWQETEKKMLFLKNILEIDYENQ
jgi:menaquinone-specific isochorismate synthase